jgi:ribosomal protein L40E
MKTISMVFALEDDNQPRGLLPCPKCGDFIEMDSEKCPSCNAILKEKVKKSKTPASKVSPSEGSLFICSKCGAFIGNDATSCKACGTKRVSMDALQKDNAPRQKGSTEGTILESSSDIYICDSCGALLGPNSERCGSCGVEIEQFDDVGEDEEVEVVEETEGTVVKELLSSQGELFLCTKCGAFMSPNSVECGICGIAVKDMKAPPKDKRIEPFSAESRLSSPGMLFICDSCGAFMRQDSKECTICGTSTLKELRYGDEEEKIAEVKLEQVIPEKIFEETEIVVTEEKVLKKPEDIVTPKKASKKSEVTGEDLLKEAEEIESKLKLRSTKRDILEDCVKLWFKKAVALRKLGKHREALKSLNSALSVNQNDEALILEKADIYYEIGRYKHAVKLYLHLLESDPESISLLNRIGNALFRLGSQKESLRCFERALSLDANHRETLVNKGYLLMKQERYEEAMECADKIMVYC